MVLDSRPGHEAEDQYLIEAGYQPRLHRKLSSFASFAIAFSCMSVLVGVFAVWSFTLQSSGPFGVWTWPAVVCGQLLIALVFAEMAGRIPLAGSIYNWNARMGNPTLGWQAGWLIIFSYSVGGVAAVVALMTPLQSLLGISLTSVQIQTLGVLIILVQLFVNIYGVRFAGALNRYAVVMEISTIVVLSIALVVAAALHGGFHPALITHIPTAPAPYWQAFLASSLLGLLTLIGFESPGDISEETVNARAVAPRSIIGSVAFSGILGFIFILILSLVIPNLAQVTASADPVSTIVSFYLGTIVTKLFLLIVVIAIFAVSLLIIMYVSRLIYAVARDERILGAKFLNRMSPRGVPVGAAVFVALVEIALLLIAFGQVALFSTNAVLTALVYLVTIINFARASKTLPPTSTFSLGKWRPYVVGLAIVWLLFTITVLTVPAPFHLGAYISLVIIVAGFILQAIFGRKGLITATNPQ